MKYSVYDKTSELYSIFVSNTPPSIKTKTRSSYLVPWEDDILEIPSDAQAVGTNSVAQGFLIHPEESRNLPSISRYARDFWWGLFLATGQWFVWRMLSKASEKSNELARDRK